ncbi:MAG: sigma-70 family RNA polymerase sigma factor [Ilumatobacteraceae bacterium]|nr:sigma-70 family RNA polymerase sigma factor [Ilumatobacteraceae bacterium]
MSPAPSDESLLAGLGVGDAAACTAFVRRFQSRVYGLALGLVGDAGAAEDVAQEAFARAWRHAQIYDARRGSVATWLLAITRNLAIDTLRMRRPQPADPESILALQPLPMGPAIDDTVAVSHAVAALGTVLRRLPDEQRRALLLAAFYGYTAKEISEAEGVPLGTAKTRIRSAMLKLRAERAGAERPS